MTPSKTPERNREEKLGSGNKVYGCKEVHHGGLKKVVSVWLLWQGEIYYTRKFSPPTEGFFLAPAEC